MVFTSLNMSMIRSVALYLGVVMLAGCASSINLNDVPVEDRQGTVVPAGSGGAGEGVPSGDVATRGGVEGVALDPTKRPPVSGLPGTHRWCTSITTATW